MYLLVFTFLVVGLLGIYAQVFGVQAARMAAGQHAIADMMMVWHSGQVSLAQSVVSPAPTSACSLTYGLTSVPYCTTNIPGNTSNVTLTNSTGNVGSYVNASGSPYPHFPSGYRTAFKWNTVYYPDASGQRYVVTWVPLPASGKASDPVTAPPIGVSVSDLALQLRNAHTPLFGYGTVSGGVLTTGATVSGAPVTYTMPSAVPNGSVAVITIL